MHINALIEAVRDFFQVELNKPASVIGVSRTENGWGLEVETIEDSDYMRKRGQDDLVALYVVEVSEKIEITGFRRKGLRQRAQLDVNYVE